MALVMDIARAIKTTGTLLAMSAGRGLAAWTHWSCIDEFVIKQ
jgi:hypothetical protein